MGQVIELLTYWRIKQVGSNIAKDLGIKTMRPACIWREYITPLFVISDITDTNYKIEPRELYCAFPFLHLLNNKSAMILPFRRKRPML